MWEYRSFAAQTLERVKGIEPSYAAWEAAVLPLNYTRIAHLNAKAAALWQGGLSGPAGRDAKVP